MSLAECTVCRGPKRCDGTRVLDALYRGPRGHAPQDECFDCWCCEWVAIIKGETDVETVLKFLSDGWVVADIASALGRHRSTIYRWLQPLRLLSPSAVRQIAGLRVSKGRGPKDHRGRHIEHSRHD